MAAGNGKQRTKKQVNKQKVAEKRKRTPDGRFA